MLNLLPVGQLDGGHIAYALFDTKQNRYGRIAHYGLIAAFAYNFTTFNDATTGFIWILWFFLLSGLRRLGGGVAHPPTDPGELSPVRRAVAAMCLVLFAVIFMPTPMRQASLYLQNELVGALTAME
jgi:membrane-associated protease RseP (regulator of RpoE activity)